MHQTNETIHPPRLADHPTNIFIEQCNIVVWSLKKGGHLNRLLANNSVVCTLVSSRGNFPGQTDHPDLFTAMPIRKLKAHPQRCCKSDIPHNCVHTHNNYNVFQSTHGEQKGQLMHCFDTQTFQSETRKPQNASQQASPKFWALYIYMSLFTTSSTWCQSKNRETNNSYGKYLLWSYNKHSQKFSHHAWYMTHLSNLSTWLLVSLPSTILLLFFFSIFLPPPFFFLFPFFSLSSSNSAFLALIAEVMPLHWGGSGTKPMSSSLPFTFSNFGSRAC